MRAFVPRTITFCRRPASRWAREPIAVLALAAAVAALCGLCLHPQGFVAALGLASLIAAGAAWPWLTVRGLGGAIAFDRARAREGEPVRVRLALRNRAPWGAWGLRVHAGLGASVDAGLARVGGWRRAEVAWDFVPGRRGAYPEGRPRVASGFPFGLLVASRGLAVADELLVWPRTFPVGPIPAGAAGRADEGAAARDRPGGAGDFLGVRPYRRGDSPRRVHWPQTARLGRVVICEQEADAVPRVQVVLDVDPAAHRGAGAGGSREWAIRVAASFAVGWLDAGVEVELVVGDRAVEARGGSVARRRAALLDALARVGPAGGLGLPGLLDLPACRRFATGLRVVVATDLAVAGLGARPSAGGRERLVVLRAAAFDPAGGADPGPSPAIAPWIWVDDPGRVAAQVRRGGRGAGR